MKEILISRPVIFTLIGGLIFICGIIMWEKRNKTFSSDTGTERRQHVDQKTPKKITQNKRGKTRRNVTYTYSHSYDMLNSIKRKHITEDVSKQLAELRHQYRNKEIGTRQWVSKFAGPQREKLYPEEYYEKELEILCGDMVPEQAADYLESVRLYSRDLLKRLETVRAYQHLKALGYDMPEVREYAERVIAENPGTEIEFEARYYIAREIIPSSEEFHAEKVAAYQTVLEIDPNFQGALSGLGVTLVNNDKPAEAIPFLKKHNSVAASIAGPGSGHPADPWLGQAYEKLGDVKTAWLYYKRALTGPLHHKNDPMAVFMRHHIEKIEVGDPVFKPILQTSNAAPTETYIPEITNKPHLSQGHTHANEVHPIDFERAVPHRAGHETYDQNIHTRRTAVKAAQQTHENFLKHQELAQKEFREFLQWAETIMNADSPMDTNNLLMKEMEAHLKGGQPQFEPERIIRAFETMERFGPADGIKRLQKSDPNLAKQVQRLLAEKRAPHQH